MCRQFFLSAQTTDAPIYYGNGAPFRGTFKRLYIHKTPGIKLFTKEKAIYPDSCLTGNRLNVR